jgi:hypothetical protein
MKKILIWAGILILVLAIIAIGGFKYIEWHLLPKHTFAESSPPKSPNYIDMTYWAAHPSSADTSDLIPSNADLSADLATKPVDVFFVHSTGYVGPGKWNSNMAHENSETQSLQYMLSSMASAFNGCCDIYAPKYRQAHLSAFVNEDKESSFAALDLAYSDVERAFDHYIANTNQGRPFILVAHSQGSLHALRLLSQRIDKTKLREQMVAAYTIGYWLPMNMFDRNFINIGLCESAQQTGCIVSYDSYGEGGAMSAGVRHWYSSGWEITDIGDIACVNPLSWTTGTNKAEADLHKGAFPVEFKRTVVHMILAKNPEYIFESLPNLSPNLTWSQCDKSGVLHLAEQQDNTFSNHLNNKDKSYHLLDYSLFYGNLRHNAIVRSKAYLDNKIN